MKTIVGKWQGVWGTWHNPIYLETLEFVHVFLVRYHYLLVLQGKSCTSHSTSG